MELKTQCHEKKEKIRQTMENHKRMEKQAEEHMHAIAEHKVRHLLRESVARIKCWSSNFSCSFFWKFAPG